MPVKGIEFVFHVFINVEVKFEFLWKWYLLEINVVKSVVYGLVNVGDTCIFMLLSMFFHVFYSLHFKVGSSCVWITS